MIHTSPAVNVQKKNPAKLATGTPLLELIRQVSQFLEKSRLFRGRTDTRKCCPPNSWYECRCTECGLSRTACPNDFRQHYRCILNQVLVNVQGNNIYIRTPVNIPVFIRTPHVPFTQILEHANIQKLTKEYTKFVLRTVDVTRRCDYANSIMKTPKLIFLFLDYLDTCYFLLHL